MALAAQSLVGVLLIPLLAWALSENRGALGRALALRIAATAIAMQLAIALVLLGVPGVRVIFDVLGAGVSALQGATDAGSTLLFGYLAGAPAPFETTRPENSFLVAFRVFPIILVLSAIVKLLYHWGILQRVVGVLADVLRRTVGTGGALGTVAASSLFLGLVEAPLMIRPYIKDMGRGALFATMTVVMATIAGTVMALYASILAPVLPGAAGHLVAGSLMNIPAALMIARLMVPDGFATEADEPAAIVLEDAPRSSMDAVVQGAVEGLHLVATVAALLIVVVSLVALANMILAAIGAPLGVVVTLQQILGVLCAPLAWIIGIPWSESATAGALLGQKVVLNEFLAYLELARMPPAELSERSRTILTYALCGFANLGSLGILIGALTTMAPERRAEIAELAPRSVLAGFLATLLSAAVVGVVIWR